MIRYAITDRTNLSFVSLENDLARIAKQADMILYRDKANPSYAQFAELFVKEARKHSSWKILLHGEIELAKNLKADGVHLTSLQLDMIPKAKEFGLLTVVSCHTQAEARRAEALGADMITYSPIFESPGKGKPLGLGALEELHGIISLPIIALGGILTQMQIDACQEAGASGFASIRFFQ